MLKNFIYLYKKKTHLVFSFLMSNYYFYLMNALVYDDINQGINKIKMKVAQNEKNYVGFLFIYFFGI